MDMVPSKGVGNKSVPKELRRRLKRWVDKRDKLLKEQKGNEHKYTYWAGYERGYTEGKISELENRLDDL